MHGVRQVSDLAYRGYLESGIHQDEYLGEMIRAGFRYFPTVTREPFPNQGRITELLAEGAIEKAFDLPAMDPAHDRAMICGSMSMLKDISTALDARGFVASASQGEMGDYVIERAFVG